MKEKGLLKLDVENHGMNPFANHMVEYLPSRLTNLQPHNGLKLISSALQFLLSVNGFFPGKMPKNTTEIEMQDHA